MAAAGGAGAGAGAHAAQRTGQRRCLPLMPRSWTRWIRMRAAGMRWWIPLPAGANMAAARRVADAARADAGAPAGGEPAGQRRRRASLDRYAAPRRTVAGGGGAARQRARAGALAGAADCPIRTASPPASSCGWRATNIWCRSSPSTSPRAWSIRWSGCRLSPISASAPISRFITIASFSRRCSISSSNEGAKSGAGRGGAAGGRFAPALRGADPLGVALQPRRCAAVPRHAQERGRERFT